MWRHALHVKHIVAYHQKLLAKLRTYFSLHLNFYIPIYRQYVRLSESQLQAMLMAWVPFQFQTYLTGIAMLDMFISTFLVALIITIIKYMRERLHLDSLWNRNGDRIF